MFTLTTMWLAGNGDRRAWYVGLASQCVWGLFIFTFAAWGLLPLSVCLVVVYIRNIRRNNVRN